MSLEEYWLRVISELMKNCRRSDKELAKVLGVSQPTVRRTMKKLEKARYIQEYSLIPNFTKLGFNILAITFAILRRSFTPEDLEKGRKDARQ